MLTERALFWFAIEAMLFCYGQWRIVREALRSRYIRTWPRANAESIDSRVMEHDDGEDTTYDVFLMCKYFRGETLYIADINLPLVKLGTSEEAEQVRARHPVGRELLIASDPRRKSLTEIADHDQLELRTPLVILGFIEAACGAVWSYVVVSAADASW